MDTPTSSKKRDGQVSICKIDEEKQLEKVESYDKREQIVIYLDKEHDTNKKYQEYDEVLTPLVVFLNNILDYQGKIRIMKEYGFKEIEREVREVCDYANILEKEYLNKGIGIGVEKGIEQGTQNERIKNIRKLMIKLKMSFKEAIQFLDIPEDEVKEIEKYILNYNVYKDNGSTLSFLYRYILNKCSLNVYNDTGFIEGGFYV